MKRLAFFLCIFRLSAMGTEAALLSDTAFVAFDTETTGIDYTHGHIIELGAVKFRGNTIIATTNWLINPQIPIPKDATKVHGITDNMVKSAPGFKTIMPEFRAFIGKAPLLAHNARFDVNFLAWECRCNGLPIPENPVIDSLTLSRKYLPEAPAYNLVALSKYLNLPKSTHHRALEDSIYVQEMMPAIFNKMETKVTLEKLKKTAGVPWPIFTRKGKALKQTTRTLQAQPAILPSPRGTTTAKAATAAGKTTPAKTAATETAATTKTSRGYNPAASPAPATATATE